MKKIEIAAVVLTLFVCYLAGAVVLQAQNERIDKFCENKTGLQGKELVVNCTEVNEADLLMAYLDKYKVKGKWSTRVSSKEETLEKFYLLKGL